MYFDAKPTRLPARLLALTTISALLVALACVVTPAAPAAAAAPPKPATPLVTGSGQRYTVEIRPQLELVAGVLLVTGQHEDWERMPENGGTQYLQELKAFLEPFKDSEAMRQAAELYSGGMHTDRFATFAMHLGPLPDLDLQYDYSTDFFDESDVAQLEAFRLALKDLESQSHFDEFIAKWQPTYQQWLSDVDDKFDGDRVINWLEGFFGETRAHYHLILAPGIPFHCGLGPWINGPDGTTTFDIVQDMDGTGESPDFGSKYDLESLAAHEWGHSFVNPVVADNYSRIDAFQRFYGHVESSLSEIGYDSLLAYADEQVLRAVVTVAIEDLYGTGRAQAEIESESEQGFRLTGTLSEMFKTYRSDRGQYAEFSDYAPTMIDNVARQPDSEGSQQFAAAVIVVALLVYALVRLANSGRRPQSVRSAQQAIPAAAVQSEGWTGVATAAEATAMPEPVTGDAAAIAPPADVTVRTPAPTDEEAFVHLSRGLTLFNCPHQEPGYDLDAAMAARVDRATEAFRDGSAKRLILLAERDGVVVGYALAGLLTDDGPLTGFIDELFVDEAARGVGIGHALLAATDAWLRERCVKRLRLCVPEWNADARRFFERAGYTARSAIYQREVE